MSAAGALYARFSALSPREKALLSAGLLGVIAFIGAKWLVSYGPLVGHCAA